MIEPVRRSTSNPRSAASFRATSIILGDRSMPYTLHSGYCSAMRSIVRPVPQPASSTSSSPRSSASSTMRWRKASCLRPAEDVESPNCRCKIPGCKVRPANLSKSVKRLPIPRCVLPVHLSLLSSTSWHTRFSTSPHRQAGAQSSYVPIDLPFALGPFETPLLSAWMPVRHWSENVDTLAREQIVTWTAPIWVVLPSRTQDDHLGFSTR